ncbi:MAG: glycosyl hydrolase 115 family protein [Bacteroidales bacterium]|nr:glycosyl hydrolase 115 family protein [Bacteroidales bacterium]
MRKRLFAIIVAALASLASGCSGQHDDAALFQQDKDTYCYIDEGEPQVVFAAFDMLAGDVSRVFGSKLLLTDRRRDADIIVASSRGLKGKWETFCYKTAGDGLVVLGSDARGKAYGLLELSRMIGVSPWEWWADVTPQRRGTFMLSEVDRREQGPSVQYRGIFLNDEDWGINPWAEANYGYELVDGVSMSDNPRWKGALGPQVYEKIFQLLLRLRANAIWPAMHECTVPFYFVKGNRAMAEKYAIVVGTSHCEPLMRNSASEWDVAGVGDYNFITNSAGVLDYWSQRLAELDNSDNIFTIGMRGKHDGMMQGVRTQEEHMAALSEIIPAQQKLLTQYIDPDITKIPQAFIPYKEVLEVYDAGLEIPDYVTLVWCDDNYGYIRRLSDAAERQRTGGSGVYYHVSYWGRPHDYLWLSSTSPALIYSEMKRAYDYNARKLWILNVGDIKPAEYATEFFMDMAWNIDSVDPAEPFAHLRAWAAREFGGDNAGQVAEVMEGYYRLANFRKPEHTGWSRVEEGTLYPATRGTSPVFRSEYNQQELCARVDDYKNLAAKVRSLSDRMPPQRRSAFFELVEYPVLGASAMNVKWLGHQMAGSAAIGRAQALEWQKESLAAYDEIQFLTERYNALENGKWKGIMSSAPRDLPVFAKPGAPERYVPAAMPGYAEAYNAADAEGFTGKGMPGLGHGFEAVPLVKGQKMEFNFTVPKAGRYTLFIGTLPNHDVDGEGMKIAVSRDGSQIAEVDYSVEGRSEQWKLNVLRGQALSSLDIETQGAAGVTISLEAVTDNVIVDQIMLLAGDMTFYEFPVL